MLNYRKVKCISEHETHLVDQDLSLQARELTNSVMLSFIPPLQHRSVSVFLGSEQFDAVTHSLKDLPFNLMMECLKEFIHENRGQIVLATNLDCREEVGRPQQRVVKVGNEFRHILYEGFMFIYFETERVVIQVDKNMPDEMIVRVMTNKSAGLLWDRWESYTQQHNYLRGQAFFADGEIIERNREYTWDDVFIPPATKLLLKTYIERFITNRQLLKELGVKGRRGIILAGPPGSGKTLIGKVLADTLTVSFLWVTPRQIQGGWSFKEIMTLARQVAPVVLFFEDLDLFAEERDRANWIGLGELMNQLDGAIENEDIITIATTNRLEVIETALRNRPGRFDRIIEIGSLDAECRRQMLQKLLRHVRIQPDDLGHLVDMTQEYTGAQLEELVNTLFIMAVNSEDEKRTKSPQDIVIDRSLITHALMEVNFEVKKQMGFQAA